MKNKFSLEEELAQEKFDHVNPSQSHLEKINLHINHFKKTLATLQQVDRNMVLGASIGSCCYLMAGFPLFTSFSIAAFCFSVYHVAKRDQYYIQYQNAMKDLTQVYHWCMGKETGGHYSKLAMKTIQDLIVTLGPWVSSSTIFTWNPKDLKQRSSGLFANRREDIPEEFEKLLIQLEKGTQATHWSFRLYGEHGIKNISELFKLNPKQIVSNVFTHK